ncbi:MAG: carbohydrate kinase family protein [Gammaproteobacteria bacterium]
MTPVVVVGNAVLDVCVEVDVTELPVGRQVPTAVTFRAGGGLSNVGLDLAELGVEVRAVGVVGDDRPGHMLGDMLPWQLVRCTGHTTEVSVIATRGDRTIMNQQGSASASLDQATSLVPDGVQLVMAYLNCSAVASSDTVAFVQAVRERTIGIVAGINGVFSQERRMAVLEALPYIDLLVLNDIEARWLTGLETLEDVLSDLEQRVAAAMVTCGAKGAVYVERTFRKLFGAEPVAAPRSLGAGDALLAGVTRGLAAGKDRIAACADGCEVAAAWVRGEFGYR